MNRAKKTATLAEAIALAQEHLEAAGVETPLEDGVAMLGHLLGVSRSTVLLERKRELNEAEWQQYLSWLSRRAAREPLQHILGVAYFTARGLLSTSKAGESGGSRRIC